MKYCKFCEEEHPLDWYNKHPTNADGLDTRCKIALRSQNFKRKYGIDYAEFTTMLEGQDSKCKLCSTDIYEYNRRGGAIDAAVVDHCHETGKVRGILCDKCNRGLGYLGDNYEGLQRAANYLKGE